jgi:hypothetical protein
VACPRRVKGHAPRWLEWGCAGGHGKARPSRRQAPDPANALAVRDRGAVAAPRPGGEPGQSLKLSQDGAEVRSSLRRRRVLTG